MSSEISILLVDDQRLIREGIRVILELEQGFCVVGEADTGQEAINLYSKLNPDVILMDIQMPGIDGIETTRRILNKWSEAKIIYLTTFDDDDLIFEGLRAGALGYLLKDVTGSELIDAIHRVHQGGALIEPSIARKVLAEFTRITQDKSDHQSIPDLLSDREMEILILIGKGESNKDIAGKLYLAEGTVKNYVSSILLKLEVSDRTAAAIKAHELGLI